jgi:RNA polymerase sigma-70 factor (ECF subfamily)
MLRETEGLSYKEIAQKTGCKTGTVMSRIFNARKAIQTDMKDFLS